jgi:hypothetical protein
MLQCLVAAARPLRVAELAEVLAFDFSAEGIPKLNPGWRWEDHEEAVMSTCSKLVIIVDDKDEGEDKSEDGKKDKNEDSRIVQFSHFSVKEFLMSSQFAESSRDVSHYHVVPSAAHTILAQACLGILLQLDDRVNRNKIKNFPLAKYAAQYWVKHPQAENVLSHIKDGIERLSTRISHTLRLGSGFITKTSAALPWSRCSRQNWQQSPYITPHDLDFVT